MNLINFIKEECVEIDTNPPGDKNGILEKIASIAARNAALKEISPEEIFKKLLEREEAGSTGVGGEIAIPHCRFENISEFAAGLYLVPEGVDFEAIDGKKVRFIFFIIGPESDRDTHIRILSAISRTMAAPGIAENMLRQKSSEALREIFLKSSPEEIKPERDEKKSAFQIYIREDGESINDVLQILSSLGASCAVTNSNSAGRYLNRLPLFSTFWNSESRNGVFIVNGCISTKLVNEMIRSIDVAVGGIDGKHEIMITVQECIVTKGSLDS